MKKKTLRVRIEPFLYLLPFSIGIFIFILYPIINVFLISFKEGYNILSKEFIQYGLKNYQIVINDPNFKQAIINTTKYVITVVPLSTIIALFVANLLNKKFKFRGLLQTAYFMPMVTSTVAVGLAWKWMYNFDYGIINYVVSLIGGTPINWLNDSKYGLSALIIYGVWNILPFTIIIFLGGLQNIDKRYYIAAKIDGANSIKIFFRITLPLLAPTIGLVLIINIINTSKVFDELFPLFNGQPGIAYSLYTIVYYIYEMFYVKWKLGPAAASAFILFAIVFVLTMIQLHIQKRCKY